MSDSDYTLFSVDGKDRPLDTPLIYIASALTNLDQATRCDIQFIDDHINATLVENGRGDDANGPLVRVHSPYTHSNPDSDDGRSGDDIYCLNVGLVHDDCDGMVVIARAGGSLGSGQELAWAAALGIPILVVHRAEERLSRQVEGTAERYDIEIRAFESPAELKAIVKSWSSSRKRAIEDGPRRRRERRSRIAPLHAALGAAWGKRDERERGRIADLLHQSPARLDELIDSPALFAALPVSEASAFGTALGLEMPGALFPDPVAELSGSEEEALADAAEEHGWSSAKVIRLASHGRLEKAKGGVRRFKLDAPADWISFEERAQ